MFNHKKVVKKEEYLVINQSKWKKNLKVKKNINQLLKN